MLYVRMLLSMVIGLYTSRVVLQTLGVEDYGIYGVVGGIVSMLNFLNVSMSAATGRFITSEMGKGDKEAIGYIFSSSLIVHIIIAVILFVLSETIGLWFLYTQLEIPENRFNAALWVYQCSVITAIVGVTQAPYTAVLTSRERFDIYAYFELISVFLKLLVVYLLLVGNFDKLVLYSILQLLVSVFILLLYRIYCIKNFAESRFHFHWDFNLIKPILSFSGLDLFGHFSVIIRQQGVAFLINIFFGVIYNAASSIAATLYGTIASLASNIINAFRPAIVKYYSAGFIEKSMDLIYFGALLAGLLLVTMAVPLFCEADYVLKLWLVDPPEMSVLFCRLLLIEGCFSIIGNVVGIGLYATGDIKGMSLWGGLSYLLVVPSLWVLFYMDCPIWTAYLISIIQNFISLIIRSNLLSRQVSIFSMQSIFTRVLFPMLVLALFSFLLIWGLISFLNPGFVRCFFSSFISICSTIVISYFVFFNTLQRNQVRSFICAKLKTH